MVNKNFVPEVKKMYIQDIVRIIETFFASILKILETAGLIPAEKKEEETTTQKA